MNTYTVRGHQLANAYDRAAFFMINGYKSINSQSKMYTISGALNFAIGHDKTAMIAARCLLQKRLEGMNAVAWLTKNGVPTDDLTGLKGMRNIRSWRILWAQKLAQEFANKADEEFTFNYPF